MTSGGDAFHTALLQVDEGDILVDLMTLTGQTGSAFNYRSEFQDVGNTALNVSNIAELLWRNETLEAYGVQDCSDYPASDYTRFWPINLQTGATNPTMAWTPVNAITDCNQHAIIGDNSSTQGSVAIYFRNPKESRFAFAEMLVRHQSHPALALQVRLGRILVGDETMRVKSRDFRPCTRWPIRSSTQSCLRRSGSLLPRAFRLRHGWPSRVRPTSRA